MSGPLPIRTGLACLETPASYAARLAHQNGLKGAHDFCVDQELDIQRVADGDPWMLKRLAELGGVPKEDMFRFAVKRQKHGSYRVANQLLEKRWIIRTSLRLCPHCVAAGVAQEDDGVVGKAPWHIPFFRSCPKHRVLLCSFEPVGYAGSRHDFTKRCLALRWDIARAAQEATAIDKSDLSEYIERRILGALGETWIDTLELNAAAYFCELLGLLIERGADVGVSTLSDGERAHVGAAGYNVAKGGPDAVRRALFGLPRPLVKSKAQAHLGSLYQWLSRSAKGSQYDPVKDVIRDYIVESFPIGSGETVLGQVVRQRRVYNLTTFTRDSRTSMKRSRQALIAAGLINPNAAGRNVRTSEVFCAKAAKPVLDKLNGGITRRLALNLLNIPRAQFDALTSGDVLTPMPGLGAIAPYYARSDVLLLRDQLGQVKGIGSYPEDMVDIQTACRKLVCGAAEIVQLIVEGHLEWIGVTPEKEGYTAVLVSVAELGGKLEGVGVEGFTKAKVKQILSVNDPAVKFLVEAGFLKAVASRNPVTRKAAKVVLPKDMDRFLESYVPAKFLARDLGTTPRSIIARMRRLGIPILHMSPGCIGTIYDRKLLASELGIDL